MECLWIGLTSTVSDFYSDSKFLFKIPIIMNCDRLDYHDHHIIDIKSVNGRPTAVDIMNKYNRLIWTNERIGTKQTQNWIPHSKKNNCCSKCKK